MSHPRHALAALTLCGALTVPVAFAAPAFAATPEFTAQQGPGFSCLVPEGWNVEKTKTGIVAAEADNADVSVGCTSTQIKDPAGWADEQVKLTEAGGLVQIESSKLEGDTLTIQAWGDNYSFYQVAKIKGTTVITETFVMPVDAESTWLPLLQGRDLIWFTDAKKPADGASTTPTPQPTPDAPGRGLPAKTGVDDDLATPLAALGLGLTALGSVALIGRRRR